MLRKIGQTLQKGARITKHIVGTIKKESTKQVVAKEITDSQHGSVEVKDKIVTPTLKFNAFEFQENDINVQQEYIDETLVHARMKELQKELSEALAHWKWTKQVYHYAIGPEQVEYCIYQMMAAEQKYRMTLLKARELKVDWSKIKGDMI